MLGKDNIYSGTFDPILQEYERLRKDIRTNFGFLLIKIRGKLLYFKIPVVVNGEKQWKQFPTGEELTLQGLAITWMKAQKVAEFLKGNPTVTQLQDFFDNVINKEDFNVVDDGITVQEAIKVVYQDFFNRRDRRKLTRRKSSKSDNKCWYTMYGYYYSKLNPKAKVTFSLLKEALDIYGIDDETGQTNRYLRRYQEMLYAFIRLCKLNKLKGIAEQLEELKVPKDQWKVQKIPRQKVMTAQEFYYLRKRVLEDATPQTRDAREFWMWVFSVQFCYALRISEVLHIKNWVEYYNPSQHPEEENDENFNYPPLIDPKKNPDHMIYIGNFREEDGQLEKWAKTGKRYVIPAADIDYPNMFYDFEILEGIKKHVPRLLSYKRNSFVTRARKVLSAWTKRYLGREISHTHTIRRMGVNNFAQQFESPELRAMFTGQSPEVFYRFYQEKGGAMFEYWKKYILSKKKLTSEQAQSLKEDIERMKKDIEYIPEEMRQQWIEMMLKMIENKYGVRILPDDLQW
ncbi:MAG: hypothetical protein QXS29_09920 [Nitrososphaeria archaeon]